MAAPGDAVPIAFAVQDRGGADPGQFQVQVLLGGSNLFDASSQVLATFARGNLVPDAAGHSFSSPPGFAVTLPATRPSGPAFLGLRIVVDPNVPEAGLYDKSGVHRGIDWQPLTIETPAPAGAIDLSRVDAGLFTEIHGTLGPSHPVDAWSFTVGEAQGLGELKAELAVPGGAPQPVLTLSGPAGDVLIQSASGSIVQPLQAGTYLLTATAKAGASSYRLTTSFTPIASMPFDPLASGAGTASVAVGDVNGDGIPDIVTANRIDDTVSVYLGLSDATFQPPRNYDIGARVWHVTLASVTDDGRLDIITTNKGANTVSVLLGNGDGTFQPQIVVPAGTRPQIAIVAKVNGDGTPDLIFSNYAADSVWVLRGHGDGTFGSPTIYPTEPGAAFSGASGLAVADLRGDGVPDLIYTDYVTGNVVVRLGLGDGTFGPEATYHTGAGAYQVQVADVNGDGIPDLVAVNAVADDVSVLLGKGDGTFGPAKSFKVGLNPYSMALTDFNGDGIPDVVTANRGDNTVSVLLDQGDGTFAPEVTYPTGKTPRAVAVGDLTGDGRPDIVVANLGDDSASVLLGRGDGTFSFGAQQSAPAPPVAPFQVVVADVNGDGIPDIVTANRPDNSVSVLLGNRDGSFQTKETFATDRSPFSVAVADINGDGIPDILTANYDGADVSVLLGNGDGTLKPAENLPAGSAPYNVKVADLNGDGIPDIIVTNKNDNTVGVLLGRGQGAFAPMVAYPVASGPYEVVAADLTGNGKLDLVVSHFSATVVDVLLGNGDGTFQPTREFPVGSRPYGLAVADLNGDGRPDIVTSDYRDHEDSVLLNQGGGNFSAPQFYPVGKGPNEVQIADLDGDGIPDIVTANYGSDSVSVLLGRGDGTFGPAQSFPAGSGPASVAIAQLLGDHHLDLVAGNRNASSVTILRGTGDGTFGPPMTIGVGKDRYSAAVSDLTGDGIPDIVTASELKSTVTVQLGNGDGTFGPGAIVPVGPAPTAVAVVDLNGDGRPDLVTANSGGDSVSVLLGNGDGTFSVQQTFPVGRSPRAVVIADLLGDGIPDLVVADYNDNTVSVLLGRGDGTFLPREVFPVGAKPYALTVAALTGDGRPDIVVANSAGDTVSVLTNLGGSANFVNFAPQATFPTGKGPRSVTVADLNGDGISDILTADTAGNAVSVLDGNGDGTFLPPRNLAVGSRPYSIAVADLNGDGKPDLVATNYGDNSVSVLLNDGTGAFPVERTFATDKAPVQTIIASLNGDGRAGLVTVSNFDSAVGVMLGRGDGTFQPVSAANGVGIRSTPFLVDVNGDGIPDSVVLDRSGNILFRQGLPGSTGAFASPMVLNPGRPARAIAVLHTGPRLAIAAADAHYDRTLAPGQFLFTVSIYTIGTDGTVERRTAFSTTSLPTSLAAAPLAGGGVDALIAANALDDSVTIAMQGAPGQFAPPLTVPTGIAPSDIAVADVNGDALPDVLVSDQASGDVTVILNDASHTFEDVRRFRAGTWPYGLEGLPAQPSLRSFAQSVTLVVGDFSGQGRNDLAVVNQATHRVVILAADGHGSFADPQLGLTFSTSDGSNTNARPGAIAAGDFNRDGTTDLAVLMEDTGQVWIYAGQGDGTFRHTFSIPVGDAATGLAVVPGNGPGLLNLLVGNGFGDVLTLEGRGDGTFQIQGTRVSLSVVPNLLGPGQAGVLVGNQQSNRVTVQAPSASGHGYAPVGTLGSAASPEQLAPGFVEWAFLDRDATLPDAIVVSTGSNAVVVYRTTAVRNGAPVFAPDPRTYFVGTAPASLTVADVNGDGIPDMVIANQGSNDVSLVFGSYDTDGAWLGTPGPRLKAGGDGPLAVVVRDLSGDNVPDLAVIDGDSGTVVLLPGVGRGFFDDRRASVLFHLGGAVAQPPTFAGDSGVGYAVTVDGGLVRFDLKNPSVGAAVVFSAQPVLTAQALPDGQVVAALAGGSVAILAPAGNGLSVVSELHPQGATPTLASSLQVVNAANGSFNVLVTSQGSDTIFVFAQGGTATAAGAGATGGPALASFSTGAASGGSATQVVALTASVNAAGAASTSASTSSSASAAASTASATGAAGISLGQFTSSVNASARGTDTALLVPIEGNAYLSVPILGFGHDDEEGREDGQGRMPWLSERYPLGDPSPRTRFLIGLDGALEQDRGVEDEGMGPAQDPWNEDLFSPRLPIPPRSGLEPGNTGAPEAALPKANDCEEREIRGSSSTARLVARLQALAGVLAATLLMPARATRLDQGKTFATAICPKAVPATNTGTSCPGRKSLCV
jgi:hypothetical protein